MLYGTEYQGVKKQNVYKMSTTKMKILRWINRNTRKCNLPNIKNKNSFKNKDDS